MKGEHFAAVAPIALLWVWILATAGDPGVGAWPLLLAPLAQWFLIDWLASGWGVLKGPNSGPRGVERFLCYLFMGVGTLPFLSAGLGLMALEHFKPEMLPPLFGDGVDVALFCLMGLIATSAMRLLGWPIHCSQTVRQVRVRAAARERTLARLQEIGRCRRSANS